MTTGFQGDIERGTTRAPTCMTEGKNLSVGETGTQVKSLTDDPSSIDDDGTDQWIRARCAQTLCREAKRQGHVLEFLWASGHRFLRATRDRRRPDRVDVVDFSPFLASASANAAWAAASRAIATRYGEQLT